MSQIGMLQQTYLYVYIVGIHVHFPSQCLKGLSDLFADCPLKIKIPYGGSGIVVILESLENYGVLFLPIK